MAERVKALRQVKIVQCKDCKYSRLKKSGIKLHCKWWYRSVEDTDYCSRGESKEDGQKD